MMRPRETRRSVALAVLVGIALLAPRTDAALGATARFEFMDENREAHVETISVGDLSYFSLEGVALAVSGIRYWSQSTGKVTLSVSDHLISMTPDSRFVVIDTSVENLMAPVVIRHGAIWVPPGFITGVLARALDAEVVWRPSERLAVVGKLRPSVESVSLSQTPDGTVVEIGLTSPAAFSARSRSRAAIEVIFPSAQLPDSLGVSGGTDHVSGVIVEGAPEGVRVEISVTEEAGSYTAESLRNPPRVRVLVRGGYETDMPPLELRDVKHLLPESDSVFGAPGLDLETVMIDPAHGGGDPGAVGRGGLEEKSVTLALARELSQALQRKGFYVFMTRTSDSYVPDHRRAELANLSDADIFVSLQCGAWFSGWARGFTVSYYEPPGEPEDDAAPVGRGLPRVRTTAPRTTAQELDWEGLQESHLAESRALARAVDGAMSARLSLNDRGTARRSSRVLAGCAMPAIGIELGFITNRDEEDLLSDNGFLREAARAIADGIAAYRSGAKERAQ